VENSTGTVATQYAYGDPDRIADNTRVEFTPVYGTPPAQGPGRVTGTVTDALWRTPIEGAEVLAMASGGDLYSTRTGADGTYWLELCPDSYTMAAEDLRYVPGEPVPVVVAPGASVVQDFALHPLKDRLLFLPVVLRNYP
jgi:hypothetical protein